MSSQAIFALIELASGTTQTVAGTSLDLTQILQFGLLGLIFVCILLRKYLVPEWVLKEFQENSRAREAEQTARLNETREQLDRLQDVFQDQMIPALTRATEINARYTEELQRARFLRKQGRDDEDRPDGGVRS